MTDPLQTTDATATDASAAARAWLITLHAPAATDADREACARWRKAASENETAFRDAERVWALFASLPPSSLDEPHKAIEPAPAPASGDARSMRPTHGFRHRLGASLAIAATLAAVALFTAMMPPGGVRALLADTRTSAGEMREVRLPDGSRVQLNGGTAFSYSSLPDRRVVTLVAGQAFFSVAHDPLHPFFVQAGAARIRVTGTQFEVRRSGDDAMLTVLEGSVEASLQRGGPTVRVGPPEQVSWIHGEQLRKHDVDIHTALAWRTGRLIFKSQPLAEVVDELVRYRPGFVFVVGEAARTHSVTGVFDMHEPDAVLEAIGQSLPVRVTRLTPFVTIIH